MELNKHKVYQKVDVQECIERIGKKLITVRWVDVEKGDKQNPECRSRLVAKEIRH